MKAAAAEAVEAAEATAVEAAATKAAPAMETSAAAKRAEAGVAASAVEIKRSEARRTPGCFMIRAPDGNPPVIMSIEIGLSALPMQLVLMPVPPHG